MQGGEKLVARIDHVVVNPCHFLLVSLDGLAKTLVHAEFVDTLVDTHQGRKQVRVVVKVVLHRT